MSDSALPLQHFRYDINCDATFPTHHFRYSIFATAISVQHFRYKIFNTAFPIHHFRYRISGTTPSRERVQCSIFDARCRIPHFQNIIFGSTVGSSISATPFGYSIFERTFSTRHFWGDPIRTRVLYCHVFFSSYSMQDVGYRISTASFSVQHLDPANLLGH